MTISTLDAILVPVASVEDARTTCRAVCEYFDADETLVTFVFVIEKAGGAPDKAGVEQREEVAESVFEAVADELPDFRVETTVVYDTDVARGVFDAAAKADADAVAFVPRPGNRLSRFLSGDVALSLVTENELPVISLPKGENEESEESKKGEEGEKAETVEKEGREEERKEKEGREEHENDERAENDERETEG